MTIVNNGDNSRQILFYTMFFLGITGSLSPFQYNILPANGILEITFIISALFMLPFLKNKIVFAFFTSSTIYVVISIVYSTFFKQSNLLDTIQVYKAFIYIPFLCLFIKKDVFTVEHLEKLFKILSVLFLFKYTYSRILAFTPRLAERPGLFTENNFELMLYIFIFVALYHLRSREMIRKYAILFVVVAISGSRSALFAAIITFLFCFINFRDRKTIYYMITLCVIGLVGIFVFQSRMAGQEGGIESIDRYKFLSVFLYETRHWTFLDFLLGSERITPLSYYACSTLSYYSELFSYSDKFECYSVILHSYILRVVFDHGLLAFFYLLFFIFIALKMNNIALKLNIAILLSLLANAMSVSAFNSIYVCLGLAILFSCYDNKKGGVNLSART